MTAGKDPAKQPPARKTPDEKEAKRRKEDKYLDDALEGTFPASDPVAPPRYDDSKN